MVNIEIIAVGKDKDVWLSDAIAHFEKLLKKYARIHWTILNTPKKSASLSPAEIKKLEAVLLSKYLHDGTIVALADSGKKSDSAGFAKQLEKMLAQSSGKLKFLIGGPYGLHDSVLKHADYVVSLSSLTFSHQVIRIVLLEQLFRAFSILHNTDYHK